MAAQSRMANYRAILPVVIFVSIGIAATCSLHEFFTWYGSSVAKGYSGYIFLLVPGPIFWYAPAAVLGTTVAYLIVYSASVHLLPWRTRLTAVLLVIGSAALVYFAAHSNLRLEEKEMVFRRLWSFEEERHSYSRVKGLSWVRHSGDESAAFVIEFDDAPKWTTRVEVIFPDEREQNFLAEKSGKMIEDVKN